MFDRAWNYNFKIKWNGVFILSVSQQSIECLIVMKNGTCFIVKGIKNLWNPWNLTKIIYAKNSWSEAWMRIFSNKKW